MRQVPQAECLDWLRTQGVEYIDDEWNSFRYADQRPPGIKTKSWKVPNTARGLANFWEDVFSTLPAWNDGMMIYPRDQTWEPANTDSGESNDLMYSGFLRFLRIDLTEPSGIYVAKDEGAVAAWILLARMTFGWCVGDDTIVVPKDAPFLIRTSHHDYIDVQFRDEKTRDSFDAAMTGFEYDFVRWTGEG